MHNSQVQNDVYKQLKSDIEQLRAEIKQERALRLEVEANYELLKQHYEQAICYIQKPVHRNSSNNDSGCFFGLFITLFFFFNVLFDSKNVTPF